MARKKRSLIGSVPPPGNPGNLPIESHLQPPPATPVAAPDRQNLLDTGTVALPPEPPAPSAAPEPVSEAQPPEPAIQAFAPAEPPPAPSPAEPPPAAPAERAPASATEPAPPASPLPSTFDTPGPAGRLGENWFVATGAPAPVRAADPEEEIPIPPPRKPPPTILYVLAVGVVGALMAFAFVAAVVVAVFS